MTSTLAPPDRKRLLASIRDVGHWRVRIVPESAEQRFERPGDCRDAVAASAVHLRGWDYPHIPVASNESHCQMPVQDGWEGMGDWGRHRELWRLMRSGQFIHYLALWEDITPELSGQRVLSVSGAVYTLLEVVEFARRLTGSAAYGTHADLEIDLVGVAGRGLKTFDPNRMLGGEYIAAASDLPLRKAIALPLSESRARSIARDLAIEVFDLFGLELGPRTIDGVQAELVERR